MLRDCDAPDFHFEDKVFVTKGDLHGSIGTIKNFQQGGQILCLKPLNLDGLDEICVERNQIVKYFGLGDSVLINEGKYKGESAIILDVNNDNPTMPLIKVDSSRIEVRVNTRYLRMRGLHETDKILAAKTTLSKLTSDFKVGDLINYDNFRIFGHVIAVDQDVLSVVNDQGRKDNVKISQVDKKLVTDRRRTVHDCLGNGIQMEDTVFVSNKRSPFYNQQGIIKNICRKCLFLWDRAFIERSNGIFVAPVGDVKIKGHDLLAYQRDMSMHDQDRRGGMALTNQNRIARPALLGKVVVVAAGNFKGMRGRVGHGNADVAFLEIQARLKRLPIPLNDVKQVDAPHDGYQQEQDMHGDQPLPAPAGGQTEYQHGATEY